MNNNKYDFWFTFFFVIVPYYLHDAQRLRIVLIVTSQSSKDTKKKN